MRTPIRVLIIDDNQALAENLLEIFEDEGVVGRLCTGGAEALSSLEEDPRCDLVITDFRMPNMHGLELVRLLKRANPELPVVMLTAYLSELDAEAARDLGIAEIMRKPEDLQRLVAHVLALGEGPGSDEV